MKICRKRKLNGFVIAGLLTYSTVNGLRHFITIPEFISGMAIGISISLELTGLFFLRHDISKFRQRKLSFFKR